MKKIWWLLILLFVLVVVVGLIFGFFLIKPVQVKGLKTIVVAQDDGVKQISELVYKEDVVTNKTTFYLYSIASGKYKKFQPGKHYINANVNIIELVNQLTKTPIEEIKITIPEGWRLTQIAEKLDEEGIINKDIFINYAQDKEGYLFPDTYFFTKNTSVEDVVKKMTENFASRTENLSVNDQVLIIASLVEREVKFDEDRSKVAAVVYNRLEKDMPIEFDSTVQYAKGNWEKVYSKDLFIDSPYNTYKIKGLPPSPICNPGIKSIEAALNPANTNDFYFIHTPDGKTYFAKTKAEHDQNINEYLK